MISLQVLNYLVIERLIKLSKDAIHLCRMLIINDFERAIMVTLSWMRLRSSGGVVVRPNDSSEIA